MPLHGLRKRLHQVRVRPRGPQRRKLEEHDPERVLIGGRTDLVDAAECLLRRHVLRGAHDLALLSLQRGQSGIWRHGSLRDDGRHGSEHFVAHFRLDRRRGSRLRVRVPLHVLAADDPCEAPIHDVDLAEPPEPSRLGA